MKKWKVVIYRTEYQRAEVEVEAENSEDANAVAMCCDSDEFHTVDADQEVVSVREVAATA